MTYKYTIEALGSDSNDPALSLLLESVVLTESQMNGVAKALSEGGDRVREIDLSGHELSDEAAKDIANFLYTSPSVRYSGPELPNRQQAQPEEWAARDFSSFTDVLSK